MLNMIKFYMILAAALAAQCTSQALAAQLNYGKYFGTIQMDGQPDVIAVSLDALVTQINSPTVYPALEVIVRTNLGGYTSSEYVGYDFYNPTFNFENGILQLNDPKNELTATLKVTNTDTQTVLEGRVGHRLTNAKGTMRVVLRTDEGEDEPAPSPPVRETFLPVLKGEYFGKCGADPANLQIETGRDMGANAPGNALSGYAITGRLGFSNGPNCDPTRKNRFCSLYPFSTGTYSPFTQRLTLQGPLGTLDCAGAHDTLRCKVVGYDKERTCELTKKSAAPTPPIQNPKSVFLKIPVEDKKPLPAPEPPGNDDLVNALNGTFYGFLHHENRDVYQLIEMGVVATTSTENAHIQNQVMVEPTILLRLGSTWDSAPALSLVYPQRVFWLNPGFAFQAEGNDHFAVIGDWRKGYVSGVLYSRSFGRIGTFEMQKNGPPPVPVNLRVMANPTGRFKNDKEPGNPLGVIWSVDLELPNDVSGPQHTGVPILGRYGGPGVMDRFEAASLDLNTGLLSFLIKKTAGDRLVSGSMDTNGNLNLLWPTGPAFAAPMAGYTPFTFKPLKTR